MRNVKDLKSALGDADEGFKANVYKTLATIQKKQEKKMMRKTSVRLIAAALIICLIGAGTALALSSSNTWGILDFLRERREGAGDLEQAGGIVQSDIPQTGGETSLAVFTVREAIYDGKGIFVVLVAKPTNQDYLLLGTDAMPQDSIKNMGDLFQNQSGTIEEYAEANHKTLIHTSVGIDYSMVGAQSMDFLLEADGTLVYMLSGVYDSEDDALELELSCYAAPYENGKRNYDDIQTTTLDVTLKNSGQQESAESVNTAEYASFGVRVDKVTLKRSQIAVYAEIEYTVIDPERYSLTDGSLWFDFLDENGESLPDGLPLGGEAKAVDAEGLHYVQLCSMQTMDTLPGGIALRGFSFLDKDKFETHTLQLK